MLLLAIAKEKWQSLYVVICQVHQARHDEVVTQYFEGVFNEFQGDAGAREDRIVFRESSVDDEPAALRLLATHILDQKISSAFFRDPRRMQSDVIKDAAKRVFLKNCKLWSSPSHPPLNCGNFKDFCSPLSNRSFSEEG